MLKVLKLNNIFAQMRHSDLPEKPFTSIETRTTWTRLLPYTHNWVTLIKRSFCKNEVVSEKPTSDFRKRLAGYEKGLTYIQQLEADDESESDPD